MELFEEFVHLCHQNEISFWLDWGSELGALRHSNIIPWDIDCDTCLTKDNYDKMIQLFEKNGFTIGNLTCDLHGYDDPNGCCWIYNKKYLHLGKDIFGIDCVAYEVGETHTKTLMSQKVIDECPATPSSYDYLNEELYPLKKILFLGNYVFIPAKAVDLIKRYYGNEAYLQYPVDEYNRWLKFNANKLFLLNCPFRNVPEVQSLTDGFQLNTPFVIRNPAEFHVDLHRLIELFIKESEVSSWFEKDGELFVEDLSSNPQSMIERWRKNQLKTNITDSPLEHFEFLPKFLFDRVNNLEENYRSRALCYVLTNKNVLTKFHTDTGGYGWVYLKEGQKLWWFISPEDVQYLEKRDYPLEKLRELSFTDLVFLADHYLWGKIYVVLIEENDFVGFPEHWAHRVYTYDKACGIGGYMR